MKNIVKLFKYWVYENLVAYIYIENIIIIIITIKIKDIETYLSNKIKQNTEEVEGISETSEDIE